MSQLDEYRRKRDPGRTPEPFGGGGRGAAPVFVVQRHQARRLHYDFRLERGGALASWAVPRGLPLEPGQRRLAVQVEDHPLDYAGFEGRIPAGQYGAGTVEIWDHGSYELVEEKPDGGLTVRLHGERLQGLWTLVPAALDGDPKNWLLLRKRDPQGAAAAAAGPPPRREPPSPMLATPAETIPPGDCWRFEVKWDGYRAVAVVEAGRCRLWSRRGNDLSERFAAVAEAIPHAVHDRDCILDGEVCALDEDGRSSFSAMQQGAGSLAVYVFDLLELEGRSLLDRPLEERRAQLERLLHADDCVRLSRWFEDGEALLGAAREQGLEGVLAKRLGSPYAAGRRTRDWLKVKTRRRQEFVVCGYTRGRGSRVRSFGALVLGVRRGGELVWAGNCGSGFSDEELGRLLALLEERRRPDPPFAVAPTMPRVRRGDVVWVEPDLVCEVAFVEWTHGGQLRAPVYLGLRDDKGAAEVRHEHALEERAPAHGHTVELSNLDKVFWPGEGLTKGDLVDYYRELADALVPHLRGRPFTMKRFPDGIAGKHFFQKEAPGHMPAFIGTVEVPSQSRSGPRTIRYPLVDDEAALLWMVNMGCIDMNVTHARAATPEQPDYALFDLDPAAGSGFAQVVQVALLVREALAALGLECWAKTSGADGMHVLVPLEPGHTFAEARLLVDVVARTLARAHPGLVTLEWAKARRRGVLIDANQTGPGRTIASVYSVRPLPGAPVSTPLRWEEVGPELDPAALGMAAAAERVRRHGDLFAPVLAGGQSLAAALRRLG